MTWCRCMWYLTRILFMKWIRPFIRFIAGFRYAFKRKRDFGSLKMCLHPSENEHLIDLIRFTYLFILEPAFLSTSKTFGCHSGTPQLIADINPSRYEPNVSVTLILTGCWRRHSSRHHRVGLFRVRLLDPQVYVSNITTTTTADASLIDEAQQIVLFNLLIKTFSQCLDGFMWIAGNIGAICTCIVFYQPTFRKSPCAMFFIASSIAQIFVFNVAVFIRMIQYGYDVSVNAVPEWFW